MRLEITKASVSSLSAIGRQEKIKAFIKESSLESGNGVLITQMESKVKQFEAIYSIPSSKLEEALRSGAITENEDVVQWIFAYNILTRSGKI